MGALGVVADQVGIEHSLQLLDGLEPGLVGFVAKLVIKQRTVQALDDAVGLRTTDLGAFVGDPLELQE